jgi:hypothetical protein
MISELAVRRVVGGGGTSGKDDGISVKIQKKAQA